MGPRGTISGASPDAARRLAGYQLRLIQMGLAPDDWKPMASVGSGVIELRVHTGSEYRAFSVAKFREAVYVLYAFEKRTQKTRISDISLARIRLSALRRYRAETR